MKRTEWEKLFRDCPSKAQDARAKLWQGNRPNTLCAEFFIGRRCMWRICPKRLASEAK